MRGIYCYTDLKNDEIVYVGKDSNIHKNTRHYAHKNPQNYNKQPFNRILQNNLNRYEYKVLKRGNFSQNLLNVLEILYIRRYKPKFNFTIGGDGATGYKHTNETRKKISEIHKGKHVSLETRKKMSEARIGENNPMYGKKHSLETRKKISENHPRFKGEAHPMYGRHHSEESIQKMKKTHSGKKFSNETYKKMSEAQNTTGYFRVSKVKSDIYKQGFTWRYKYYDENGNRRVISNTDIRKLERRVKSKGLEWYVLDN